MPQYRLSGVVVDSNVPLPELPPSRGTPSFFFTVMTAKRRHGAGTRTRRMRWYHHWRDADGVRSLSFAHTESGYLLRFPSLADCDVRVPRITMRARPGVPPDTIRHLLLDQVWPLVLSAAGRLVLHASAVVLPEGRAIAFAGPAGAGKSTLAASMARAGCAVASDDCLLIEKRGRTWRIVPSYPGLRLWPDMLRRVGAEDRAVADVAHYTSKKRYAAGTLRFERRTVPLAAVYVLRRAPRTANVTCTALSGPEAVMRLVPYAYLLDFGEREQLERCFTQLSALVGNVPVSVLDVPRAVHRLANVAEMLMGRGAATAASPIGRAVRSP